jgi:hypothetical protein
MSLSRRQFFRRFVKPGEKTREERAVRYELMDTFVRTHLFPYDFALTADQEAELFASVRGALEVTGDEEAALFASVRSALEETGDEELFSSILRFKVEEVVDRKIRQWRDENQLNEQSNRVTEIRHSAAVYVSTFLNGQATPAAIDQLKMRCGIQDAKALETELTSRIQHWIGSVDDSELLQYDVVSVKDLVFAQLRSWC